jgi:hypothetical protein
MLSHRTAAENVKDLQATARELVGNHVSMASPRDCLRAHEGHARCEGEEPVDSSSKLWRRHVIGVAAERLISPGVVGRIGSGFASPAELREVGVADSGASQMLLEQL